MKTFFSQKPLAVFNKFLLHFCFVDERPLRGRVSLSLQSGLLNYVPQLVVAVAEEMAKNVNEMDTFAKRMAGHLRGGMEGVEEPR